MRRSGQRNRADLCRAESQGRQQERVWQGQGPVPAADRQETNSLADPPGLAITRTPSLLPMPCGTRTHIPVGNCHSEVHKQLTPGFYELFIREPSIASLWGSKTH